MACCRLPPSRPAWCSWPATRRSPPGPGPAPLRGLRRRVGLRLGARLRVVRRGRGRRGGSGWRGGGRELGHRRRVGGVRGRPGWARTRTTCPLRPARWHPRISPITAPATVPRCGHRPAESQSLAHRGRRAIRPPVQPVCRHRLEHRRRLGILGGLEVSDQHGSPRPARCPVQQLDVFGASMPRPDGRIGGSASLAPRRMAATRPRQAGCILEWDGTWVPDSLRAPRGSVGRDSGSTRYPGSTSGFGRHRRCAGGPRPAGRPRLIVGRGHRLPGRLEVSERGPFRGALQVGRRGVARAGPEVTDRLQPATGCASGADGRSDLGGAGNPVWPWEAREKRHGRQPVTVSNAAVR